MKNARPGYAGTLLESGVRVAEEIRKAEGA